MGASDNLWREYGDHALIGCAVVAATFVLLYMFLSPWWKTPAGRNIMAVMGSLAVSLVYFTWAVNAGGIPPFFWPIRAMLFTGILLAIGHRIILFLRAHVLARRARKENRHEPRHLG